MRREFLLLWIESLTCLILVVALGWIWSRNRVLSRKVAALSALARTDDLTGLANDRSFREDFCPGTLGLILFDIDRFKSFNDTLGHPTGDEALREFGRLFRGFPGIYRVGGDEFAAIFPNSNGEFLQARAEEIQRRIQGHPWSIRPLTASFGIATTTFAIEPSELRNRADRALYQAKRQGGDRICVYSEPD